MRTFLYFTICFLFAWMPGNAQDSVRVTTLEEVVISAARTEQPIIETPRSVTVINEEMIRRSTHLSVGSLLNELGGMYVPGAQQTPGTNQSVLMRGAGSNQVAVLIDGVRITDPTSPNAAVDLSEISLVDVERIEVIRGAHSTIYGGAAVGGVINIITRKRMNPGFGVGLAWQGGAFAHGGLTSTEDLQLRYGFDSGLYISGALFRQDVRGLDATEKVTESPSFTSDRDDFRKMDGSIKVGFHDGRWDAWVSFRKAHQYAEIDDGAYRDDDNYYLEFDRDLFHYHAAYALTPAVRLSVLGSFSASERFYEDDSTEVSAGVYDKTFATGTYDGNLQTHELQLNYDRDNLNAVAGGGIYREDMNFDNYIFLNDPQFPFEQRTNYDTIGAETTTAYGFTRLRYTLGNLSIAAGGRLTHHTTAGSFVTYELSPSYTLGDLLFYGSVSTAFNPPSLYQLYDPSKGFSAVATRGNRDLQPERSLSLELGVKKAFQSGSYFTLSAYNTKVKDGIEYVYLWEGTTPVDALTFGDDRGDRYINIAEQRMSGVEVEGMVRITPTTSARGNVTFVRTSVRADKDDITKAHTGGHHVQLYNLGVFLNESVEQEHLVRRPDFIAFLRFDQSIAERLSVNLAYRYTGARYDAGYDPALGPYGALRRLDVDAYHLVDFGATWEATEHLMATLLVENIFNEEYREVAGFHTRGRGVYAGLKLRI